jgi:hypothetical protein
VSIFDKRWKWTINYLTFRSMSCKLSNYMLFLLGDCGRNNQLQKITSIRQVSGFLLANLNLQNVRLNCQELEFWHLEIQGIV